MIYFAHTNKNPNSLNPKKVSISRITILDIVIPTNGSNKTVLGDNWLTSINLLLKRQDKCLTYIAIVAKQEKGTSKCLSNKSCELKSSLIGSTNQYLLVLFVPNKNKYANLV